MLEAFLPVRKQKKKAPIRKRAPLFFLFIHDEERNFIFPHHVMFIAGNLFYIFGIMEIAAFFFQTFIVLFDGLDLFTALDGLLADKVKVIGLFSKLVQRNDSNQDNDQSQPPKSPFLGTFQLFRLPSDMVMSPLAIPYKNEPDTNRHRAIMQNYLLTASLKALPALKAGTVAFLILMVSPVRGFLPLRALRTRASKVPKPIS